MSRRGLAGLFLILFFANSNAKLQCKDENGNVVDWFVMYKINKRTPDTDPLIKKGTAYMYITSETLATGWQFSNKGLLSSTSMLAYTLFPLYNEITARAVLMYNDQPPDSSDVGTFGHAKGVVMTSGNEGFWLIHSVPNFPPTTGPGVHYSYPSTGEKNAQSFMCISVNSTQIETIASQLYINQIVRYDGMITPSLKQKFPTLNKLIDESYHIGQPYYSKATIHSIAGLEFTLFAKSDKWLKELYHDYVAPQLNNDLFVQSWRYGPTKLNTDCIGKKVYNIKSTKIPTHPITLMKSKADHSKWAISKSYGINGNWVCIGDINRTGTQKSRGGGAVCVKLPPLWTNYNNLINEREGCPKSYS